LSNRNTFTRLVFFGRCEVWISDGKVDHRTGEVVVIEKV
jgi:hypothetical protein